MINRELVLKGRIDKCPHCGQALIAWEITCPSCGRVIKEFDQDHINWQEKDEFGESKYNAE